MPDVPRDPRQLARDILSGKISIEELAREQQRQRAAKSTGPTPLPQQPARPAQNPQARVQLPKPMTPPPQRQIPRPPPPPQRTLQRFPQSPLPPQRRTAPTPQRGPQIQRPGIPQLTTTRPASTPTVSEQSSAKIYAAPQSIQDAKSPTALLRVNPRTITRNRALLRQAVVMAEILGKPLALREDF